MVVVLVHRNSAMRTFVILTFKLLLCSSFAGFNLQYTSGEWGGGEGLQTEELADY